MNRLALALAICAVTAAPALAGPPWISVEVRPHRTGTDGSWLILHTFHHGDAVGYPLSGTATALVNGVRTEVPLSFRSIEVDQRSGVFAVSQAWNAGTPWVLNIRLEDGGHMGAGAVVGVGASGEPMFVRFPRTLSGVTRAATAAEVNQLLASLAEGREPPRLARAGMVVLVEAFGRRLALLAGLVAMLGWIVRRAVARRRVEARAVA
jgi:hypothetical protein